MAGYRFVGMNIFKVRVWRLADISVLENSVGLSFGWYEAERHQVGPMVVSPTRTTGCGIFIYLLFIIYNKIVRDCSGS